ncbi:MAG: hypothetical protein WAX79_01845, partial [Candidatus Omnitrophota bacterium]
IYSENGRVIPGVSEILTEGGLNDFSCVNAEVLARAQQFGNAVHLMCELFDRDRLNLKTLDKELKPYLNGWARFKSDFKVTLIDIEQIVSSVKWGYCGKLDRVVKMQYGKKLEVLTLLDIKTSTTVGITTSLQLAAYQIAWEEEHSQKIAVRLAVQLLPDDFKIHPFNNPMDKTAFLNFVGNYKWKQKNNLLKIGTY